VNSLVPVVIVPAREAKRPDPLNKKKKKGKKEKIQNPISKEKLQVKRYLNPTTMKTRKKTNPRTTLE
jgi:hypothetical protein